MNDDKIKQSDESVASSLKKRAASPPDFAAGKFQEGQLKRQKTTSEVKESEKRQKKVRFDEKSDEIYVIPNRGDTDRRCKKNNLVLINAIYEKVKDDLDKESADTVKDILSKQRESEGKNAYDLSKLSEVLDELHDKLKTREVE
jgi:hypothetical protein